MRWDARWTLVLFATAAILYWLVQLSARPPSSLLESPRNIAVTNIPLNATHLPPPLNGTYEVRAGSLCWAARHTSEHAKQCMFCIDSLWLTRPG